MRRVAATFSYIGTQFKGYQFQEGQRTVQGEFEKALEKIYKEPVMTYGAGRTDTGVHGYGQVITFLVKYDTMYDKDVRNALNANLPSDIYVRGVRTVEENFNPRFDATRRIYHYFIRNEEEQDIFTQNNYWWFPYKLDVERMRQGAKYIEGVHDFTTFHKKSRGQDKDPVRIVYRVRVFSLNSGRVILVRVEGLSFLRRMVRNIVGALVRVGTGQWEPEMIKTVIGDRQRSASSTTAPPDGLYLYQIDFDDVNQMYYVDSALWTETHLLEGKEWFKALE
ncbi:MAG TPA: tRNA pseudouridine(38-40) synthase TruA [Thermotogota bacterium]|nr:tRNA pseudouridine(38-40) synthase TruA [Thermotogota bacterium]HPJ89852.1 tRNA pseudouridine(38-40) synthase TruA [Thermotogota bacterium]HPR95925.1 tRNA pseudouridine(38-40) synthase TruA [Thermotogota bacterium]